MPGQRSANYDWARLLGELRAKPNSWRLVPEMTARPASLVRRIDTRGVRALRTPGGIVQARAGWTGTTVDGRRIADVYLRFKEEP
jgi:hypothetical protein